jgi:hypothetical protein
MPIRDVGVSLLTRRVGQGEALLLASGTAAIEMALEILRVGPGHEVIVPDIGCHCVAAAAARSGATVVFVGVGETLTLLPGDVLAAVTDVTRAVIGVHQYGLPADIPGIRRVVPAPVTVVEDFAQAWGLTVAGQDAGSLGDLSVTSFGQTKPLSLGAGGALFGPRELLREVCGPDERERARPPTGARFPLPLLPLLPDAMTAADRRVSARRYCVARIMEFMATRGGRAAPVDPQSRPSWTRLPLYLPRTPTSEDLAGPSRFIELTQPMHDEPPSALAMFRNLPKRVVPGTSRVRDPLLVKPADEIGDT